MVRPRFGQADGHNLLSCSRLGPGSHTRLLVQVLPSFRCTSGFQSSLVAFLLLSTCSAFLQSKTFLTVAARRVDCSQITLRSLGIMLIPKYSILAASAFLFASTFAQVPTRFSGGFKTELQVSYNGDSSDSFTDGQSIPFADTSNPPKFALGDSSGVNTRISYFILMIDSTDENNFVMHFLKTDYKATGDKTGLASSAEPKVKYTPPGGANESGDRKYTFLLYRQKSDLTVFPGAGEKFDPAAFVSANGIQPAVAGLAMNVAIGGAPAPSAAPPPPPPPPPATGAGEAPATTAAPPPSIPSSAEYGAATSDPYPDAPPATYNPTGGDDGYLTQGSGSGNYNGGSPGGLDYGSNSNSDGFVMPMPIGKLVGGGIVTEMPFPEGAEFTSSST